MLKSEQSKNIQIGRLAQLNLQKGYYLYIGSALGPGGVLSRLKHHHRISKKPHWHLDYLRAETKFYAAYALFSPQRKECEWAELMAKSEVVIEPLKGFGSSDCQCDTHLFYFSSSVKMARVIQGVEGILKVDVGLLL